MPAGAPARLSPPPPRTGSGRAGAKELAALAVASPEAREKLALGRGATGVRGTARGGAPATEAGAEAGGVPRR